MQLHVLEPLFQMFYTFVSKNFSSCQGTIKIAKKIYGKSKTSIWRNLTTIIATKIC